MFDWFLRLGVLSHANERYLHGKIPTWNNFVAHPAYDEFWKIHAIEAGLKEAKVPNLNVAGWWDQEDFYGPMRTYANLEKTDAKHLNYLLVGPWNHGGWGTGRGICWEIPFGSDTGVYFRQKVEAPWFAYWLHDKGNLPLKEALLFQTGSDTWTSFDAWPPREAKTESLYFGENGKLSFEAPKTDRGKRLMLTRAIRRIPCRIGTVRWIRRIRKIIQVGWYTWLVQDQRFVNDRRMWRRGRRKNCRKM